MLSPIRPVFRAIHKFFYKDKAFVNAITHITGMAPDNLHLYQLAFTHTSFVRQNLKGNQETNERLEFLGDAILGAVIAEYLFKKYPYKDEGFLTEIRSRMVNRESLNSLAVKVGLHSLIKVDNISGVTRHKFINGNALEALVGAVYLDKGYTDTKDFILKKLVKPHFDLHQLTTTTSNFKSKLIEWAQGQNRSIRFEIIGQKQSGSTTEFTAAVVVDNDIIASGSGLSKKKAEQAAAEKSMEVLKATGSLPA
ncbi:ribonuclease III [Rufibacter tibetensis]|uniref:ribonuclease III n=1 Tax=Rufibacter tibetensis TaxID=512763 RepID=UPI0007855EBA|nr:ribonuclease III [Rufibacter tibetensis]